MLRFPAECDAPDVEKRRQIKMAKTITVKDETHARLQKAGTYSDSMDSIINRALDALDQKGG